MRKIFVFSLFILMLSCSQKRSSEEYSSAKSVVSNTPGNNALSKDVRESYAAANEGSEIPAGKKIIKTGTIVFTVNNLSGIEEKVSVKAKEMKAEISSSSLTKEALYMTIRVPVDKFDDFIKAAGAFGNISDKNISSSDATKEYYDLEERIKNKKAHLDKIRRYLGSAKNIEEILKVESEINRVTNELESLLGNFKSLGDRTAYSAVYLDFRLPYKINEKTIVSIGEKFKALYYNIINYFIIFFIGLIYFALISLPLLFAAGLIYYIGFGRVGLVKNFFKVISKENKKKK